MLFLVFIVSGCSSTNSPEENTLIDNSSSFYENREIYRIGVDDTLQINVWRNEELSVSVPVRPDGMVSVPLIGDVRAGGMTPMEVAEAIEKKLRNYIHEPQVTVILAELRSHEFVSRVRITGAVQSPASLPYQQGMTVLDAVLEAGGINEFAAPDRAKLFRKGKTGTQKYDVYLGDILNSGELETNYSLIPGDIITVPERMF
ncbi:MAG: polysaccharide biosynthesis/export family protein [Pseudomonadales bacterium]|nr:polysaccharide biosynthesis/export family protein [Pseudomonadales bacterium]